MRKPMVTRTISTTKVTILGMDITTAEPMNKVVIVPRTYKDDKKLFKAVQEAVDTDSFKAVHIVSTEVVDTLYGMTEQDFINNAIELDPETRKALETETESENATEE